MEGAFAPWHVVVLLVAFVVLFGAKRLPDSARSLGQALRIFKAETRGLQTDARAVQPQPEPERPAPPPPAE